MEGVSALILLIAIGLYLITAYRYQDRVWDDAYITFRFAKHLITGLGLTWNVGGERVEGYSSFLHLVLVALAMKVGLSPESASWGIGIGSALGTVILLVKVLRRQFGLLYPSAAVIIAIYMTDYNTAINSTTGMETQLFTFLLCVCYVAGAAFLASPRWTIACWMALAVFLSALCRPEGVLYGAALYIILGVHMGWGWMRKTPGSTSAVSGLVFSAGLFCSLGLIYAIWKYRYFGYLLPNPFYVKSNQVSLMGLADVISFLEHATVTIGPLVLGFAFFIRPDDLTAPIRDSKTRARAFLTVIPPVLAWVYYVTIIHEVGGSHRFSYPTFFYVILACAAVVSIATRAAMIAGGYGLKLGILTTLALAILAARQESWTIHRLPPDDWSQWSFKVARTLQATGLGSRATVLCDAAGVIPFISGFNQLDRVGLTNNVLSGRLYLPLDVRERYIWSQPVDVYMGYEPPAAKGAEHPEDDPRMHTAYVTKVLMGLTVFPGQDRVFVQEPRLLHQRMRELRDNWYWVGEMEWPAWQWWRLKLFLYVRKDSPYAARLLPSLRTIVTFQPDQIDLDRLQESLIQGAITG